MASGSLGTLTVDLAADIAKFQRSLNRAEKLADKRAKSIKRTFVRLSTGIGAALSAFGFVKAVEGSLQFADSIGKAADRAGIATGKFQELVFASDKFGISAEQTGDSLRRFNRRLGVALGGGSFAKDFEQLGVAIRDVEGNVRSTESVFNDVAKGIANLGSSAEQSKVSAQLFGDDVGPKLALLLRQGEQGINAFADEAQRLGLVMNDDIIRQSEQANDELSKLAQVIKVQLTTALVQAAPAIEKAGRFLADFIATAGRMFGGIEGADEADIIKTIDRLTNNLAEKRKEIEDRMNPDVTGVISMAQYFMGKNIDELREEEVELSTMLERAFARRAELLEQRDQQTFASASTGDDKNYFTGLSDSEMEAQLNNAIRMEYELTNLIGEEAQRRQRFETNLQSSVYQARSNAFNQGVGLLRRFADGNKAVNAVLIALQTAKAVKDIQIQGTAAQAQVLAYGQVEAAAHSAMFNYGAATAAIARSVTAAASIQASTQFATALAIASGAADFVDLGSSGANAPIGSVGNPITTTSADPGTFSPIAEEVPAAQTGGTITINVNGVVTDEIVNDLLIPAIQDSIDNRDVIIMRPDSRQALELG